MPDNRSRDCCGMLNTNFGSSFHGGDGGGRFIGGGGGGHRELLLVVVEL